MYTSSAQKRDFSLKAKQMRRNGLIPGSVYGKSLPESISLQMDEAAARKLISCKREGSRVQLDLEGQSLPVQIKEAKVNTLNNEIQHINFQALTADERVNSVVHIILKNTEKVTGLLENMLSEVPYSAFPRDMVDTVTIDVDGMAIGSVVTVGDIPELASDKLELQIDKDEIVLRVVEKKIITDDEDTEEASAEE